MRGESIAIPVGADDPAGAMAIYHTLLKELKQEVRLPLVTGLDAVLGTLGPAVGFLLGVMMKHDDFRSRAVKHRQAPRLRRVS